MKMCFASIINQLFREWPEIKPFCHIWFDDTLVVSQVTALEPLAAGSYRFYYLLLKVILLTFLITPGLTIIRMRGTGPGWWTRPC